MPDTTPWYRTRRGPPVVVAYAVVTIAVVAVTTGWGVDGSTDFEASVPVYVYLYGFLGGMTYAFTSIVAKFERGVRGVVRVGIRAIAALPLAAGVYLLAGPLGLPTGEASLMAGLSFLVGLYVNVSLKALGGLADRLFGRVGTGDTPAGTGGVEGRADVADSQPGGPDPRAGSGAGTRADGSGESRA